MFHNKFGCFRVNNITLSENRETIILEIFVSIRNICKEPNTHTYQNDKNVGIDIEMVIIYFIHIHSVWSGFERK